MKRNKAISMLLLVSISLAVLFTIPTHAITITEIDPVSGSVGTEVRLIGTIDTQGGAYTILFDVDDDGSAETTVKTGNAPTNSYMVNTTFVVPSCVGTDAGRDHKVTLQDDSYGSTHNATFTVETSTEMTATEYAQEGDETAINMSATGGLANTVYNFTVMVTDPAGTETKNYNVSFTTDANGFGYNITTFPTDFSTGASSNFTGTYTIIANRTLPGNIVNAATASFDIGLTNASTYERFETVNVKTSGWTPNQNLTVTIKDPSMENVSVWDPVNATDGTWSGDWTIPWDASAGTYTVEVVNATGDEKAVDSIQTFTVSSVPLTVTFKTDPASPLQRTETATAKFTIQYPDSSYYDNVTSFSSITVSVYYNTTLVDTIPLSADDYGADNNWTVSWKIPSDAVRGSGYKFSLDADSITDDNGNTGPTTAVVSNSFTVQATTLTVKVTQQPAATYMRTETAVAKINITYPDNSFYTAADLGTIKVRVYQGSTNVANLTLEEDDYDSITKQWTIGWVSPWNATLADDYLFTIKAYEITDAANPNTGPTADVSTDTFELLEADLNVASINTDKSSYTQGQVVTVYFTATYQDGSPVTTGTAAINLTMANGTTTQLTATYVPANSRFEAEYTLPTEAPLGTWSALLEAQGLKDDEDNMGPDTDKSTDFTVTEVTPPQEITATIRISPQTLNSKSNGRWVTVQIELPQGYSEADIDISTIRLDDVVKPETTKGSEEGKMVVKFSRADVITHIQDTYGSTGSKFSDITLTITGEVGGTTFQGSATIRVKN
jgi:hypothetical protein